MYALLVLASLAVTLIGQWSGGLAGLVLTLILAQSVRMADAAAHSAASLDRLVQSLGEENRP